MVGAKEIGEIRYGVHVLQHGFRANSQEPWDSSPPSPKSWLPALNQYVIVVHPLRGFNGKPPVEWYLFQGRYHFAVV